MEDLVRATMAKVSEDRVVNLARSLVDIPSTTGMERACAEFLVGYMKDLGLQSRLQEIVEGRANAIGLLKGDGGGPTLMFNGHLDTAGTGVEEEDYPVMGPQRLGDKPESSVYDRFIFGLGANNMKGGLAAAVTAIETVMQSGVKLKGDLFMTGVAGESEKGPVEGGIRSYRGARYQGGGFGTGYLISHITLPDYAVVCEPGGPVVVNAQTGYFFMKLTVKGKPGSQVNRGPGYRGVSAIDKAYPIFQRLQQWDAEYVQRHRYDSGMGIIEPHLSIGAIESGWPYKPSYSPAICNLYLDLRVTPAMDPKEGLGELEDELRRMAAEDPELKYDLEVFHSNVPATMTPPDNYLVQSALRARELVVGKKQEGFPLQGGSHYNDTNVFRWHGVPAIKCGPTGGAVPADAQWMLDAGERLSIDDLVTLSKMYVAIILDICTKTREEIKA